MRSVDLQVHISPDGTPRGATAREKLDVSVESLWAVIVEVDKFPDRIPMIHRVRLDGQRAAVDGKACVLPGVGVGLLESMRTAAGA